MRRTSSVWLVGLLVARAGSPGGPARRSRSTRAAKPPWSCPISGSVTFLGSTPGQHAAHRRHRRLPARASFGLVIYRQLKNMPVHKSMLEISELIYETCKTYLITQGKFILLLEVFIGVIMVVYFGVLRHFELAARSRSSCCSA